MCDDYDTDFDSEPEEFDRSNLIDDIQRIKLALGPDSDEEPSDQHEHEEESGLSNFSHFKASNVAEPLASASNQSSTETLTYTELKTRTTADNQLSTSKFSNIYDAEQRIQPDISLLNSVQREIPSNWSVEHELYNFSNVQQEFVENDLVTSIPSGVSRIPHVDREVLKHCLARNREIQTQLAKEIRIIDISLADNKRKQLDLAQVRYNHEADDENDLKALPSLHKFSSPYFKDSDGNGPPDNQDAKHYRRLMKINPYDKKPTAWNEKEKIILAEGVRMQNLKMMLAPLLLRLKEFESHPGGYTIKEIQDLKREIKEVKGTPPELLEDNLDGLDWDRLCCEYLTRRSPMECKLEWCHFGHPRVNRKPWKKEEDKMLLNIAKEKGHMNWNEIAQTLQTNRTPIECFKRYQRSLNKEFIRSKWTPEEDKHLIELVTTFGISNWSRIADFMEGRVGEQCMHRYMKACKPNKKGRWSEDESQKLKEAVEKFGRNWEKVAEFVPGRIGTQCRERYVNIVDPNLNKGAWNTKEDDRLLDLVQKYGQGNWSKIAKELRPRTDNQCWRRWTVLRRKESTNYRLNTVRKKREMVSNFVGRKKERPTLTPKDLDIQDIPVVVRDRKKKESSAEKSRTSEKSATARASSTNKGKLKNVLKSNTEVSKKTPKENYVHLIDHCYATLQQQIAKTIEDNKNAENDLSDVKGEVLSFTSDDDWDDTEVHVEGTILGTRSSARKRNKNVNYVEKDERDMSSDEDDVIADHKASMNDLSKDCVRKDVSVVDDQMGNDLSTGGVGEDDVLAVSKDEVANSKKSHGDKVESDVAIGKDDDGIATNKDNVPTLGKSNGPTCKRSERDIKKSNNTLQDDAAFDKDDVIIDVGNNDNNHFTVIDIDVSVDNNINTIDEDLAKDIDGVTIFKSDVTFDEDEITLTRGDIIRTDDISANNKDVTLTDINDKSIDKDNLITHDEGDITTCAEGDIGTSDKSDTTTRDRDDVTTCVKDDITANYRDGITLTVGDNNDVSADRGRDKSDEIVDMGNVKDDVSVDKVDVAGDKGLEVTDDPIIFTFDQEDIPVDEVLIPMEPVDNVGLEVVGPLAEEDSYKKNVEMSLQSVKTPVPTKTCKKRKQRTLKPKAKAKVKKEIKSSREVEKNESFLFLSVPSFPGTTKRQPSQKQKTPSRNIVMTSSIASSSTSTIVTSIANRNSTLIHNLTEVQSVKPIQREATPTDNPSNSLKAGKESVLIQATNTNTNCVGSMGTCATPITYATLRFASCATTRTFVTSSRPVLKNTRPIAPKPAGLSVGNNETGCHQGSPLSVQNPKTVKQKRRSARKITSKPPQQGVDAENETRQTSVAPFSLLLQAFRINVAAVLQKLSPAVSTPTTTIANRTSNLASKGDESLLRQSAKSQPQSPTKQSVKATEVSSVTCSMRNAQIRTTNLVIRPVNKEVTTNYVSSSAIITEVHKDLLLQANSNQHNREKPTKTPGVKAEKVEESKTQRNKDSNWTDTSNSNKEQSLATSQCLTSVPPDESPSADRQQQTLGVQESNGQENEGRPTKDTGKLIPSEELRERDTSRSSTSLPREVSLSSGQVHNLPKDLPLQNMHQSAATLCDSPLARTYPHSLHVTTSKLPSPTLLPTDATLSPDQEQYSTSVRSENSGNSPFLPQRNPKSLKEFRSPSRRKSTKPRKIRSELVSPTSTICMGSEDGNKPETTRSDIVSYPAENKSLNQLSSNNVNTDCPPPSIPPLPPTLTTLKGLRNILSMKDQLQKLAAKSDSISSSEKRQPSSNETAASSSKESPMGPNTLVQASPVDVIQTEDNEELVVVHINATPISLDPRSRRGIKKKTYTAAEQTKASLMSSETHKRETPSEREESSYSYDNRKSIMDPHIQISLYSKTPEYTLLSARFQSLFLWPMLMSEVAVSGKLVPAVRNRSGSVELSDSAKFSQEEGNNSTRIARRRIRKTSTKTPSKRNKTSNNRSVDKDGSANKRRKVNDNTSDESTDSFHDSEHDDISEDDDDDYKPDTTYKLKKDKITPTRILRPRKRCYQSAFQEKEDSDLESVGSPSTKKRDKPLTPQTDLQKGNTKEPYHCVLSGRTWSVSIAAVEQVPTNEPLAIDRNLDNQVNKDHSSESTNQANEMSLPTASQKCSSNSPAAITQGDSCCKSPNTNQCLSDGISNKLASQSSKLVTSSNASPPSTINIETPCSSANSPPTSSYLLTYANSSVSKTQESQRLDKRSSSNVSVPSNNVSNSEANAAESLLSLNDITRLVLQNNQDIVGNND